MNIPKVDARAPTRVHDAVSEAQLRTALVAAAIVLLAFACLWPTTASLMVRWEDTVHRTYTHGYLIVLISVWLIWRDRARLPPAAPSAPSFLALAVAAGAWLVAWRAGLQIVHQTLLPAMALLAVLGSCGWAVTRQMLLPLLYLYCAIPVWDALNPLLQSVSVFAVRTLLRIADIPAFFDGNRFQIPAGAFEIADGCSGLHFFVVAFSISVLYGAVNRDSLRMRVRLVAFALALAMLTNWLRIFIIVVAGHLSDMQHRLIVGEHYSFGWFMFAGAMLVFFLVARRWPLSSAPDQPTGSLEPAQPKTVAVALAIVGLAAAPILALLDGNRASNADAHRLARSVPGWTASAAQPPADWAPTFKGADIEEFLEYRSTSRLVEVFSAIYLWQEQGKEIVSHENSLLGSLAPSSQAAQTGPAPWRAALARDASGQQWLMLHVQRLDDAWLQPGVYAQLTYALRSLYGAPLSSIIVVRARCAPDCEAAHSSLQQFITAARLN